MATFIIKTDLNEYLLCVVNGVAVCTARKYEAQKFFCETDVQKTLKLLNTKKKKWSVERID